jgi:hypothetical protein
MTDHNDTLPPQVRAGIMTEKFSNQISVTTRPIAANITGLASADTLTLFGECDEIFSIFRQHIQEIRNFFPKI